MNSFTGDLRQILSAPTCIVGIGNTYRNDDVVGVMIAERLEPQLAANPRVRVVNAEDVIENHVFRIAEMPVENVLLIDAVKTADLRPGELVLGRLEDLESGGAGSISTHKLALSVAARVLSEQGKRVFLLGLAVGNTDYGRDANPTVLASAEAIVDMVREIAQEMNRQSSDRAEGVQ